MKGIMPPQLPVTGLLRDVALMTCFNMAAIRSHHLNEVWSVDQKFIHRHSTIRRFAFPPAELLALSNSLRFQSASILSYKGLW